jgi:tetratricopeptide (TPR) repeat protein
MSETGDAQSQARDQATAALQAKFDQAIALHQQGNLAEAARIYRDVLREQPNHFEALHLLGLIANKTGQTERAAELIGQAIALKPDYAEAHNNRGNALRNLKRHEAALECYDKAIALKPDFALAHNNRGLALQDLKRPEDALASYDMAITLKPDFADAYNNRGNLLKDMKRFEDALANFDRAIALRPDYAEAYSNRGAVQLELRLDADALASHDKAIALKPDYTEAHYNRGLALHNLMHHEDALASYDRAIALKPDLIEAHMNRSVVFQELMQLEAVVDVCDKVISIQPDYAEAHWYKSLVWLVLGEFDKAWDLFEWRWKIRGRRSTKRKSPQPLWLGKDSLAGKTILLYSEGGLGDIIQFCRYAKLVADLGARVILEVPKPLMSLLENLSGVAQLTERGTPMPPFDYECPLMSLPLAFKTNLSNIPASMPYLEADAEKSNFWNKRLGEKNKLRVGLVWSGGFRPHRPQFWSLNMRRNIPLAKLAALKHADIDFYSLQKGQPAESELADLITHHWDGPQIFDYTSVLNDFSDTAALIENLDLVISVDTSTAHLAGALGKPVWILNRFDTCWRWLLDRTDSPWYPTAKLYRQKQAGDWDEVIQRVKMDLKNFHADAGN